MGIILKASLGMIDKMAFPAMWKYEIIYLTAPVLPRLLNVILG